MLPITAYTDAIGNPLQLSPRLQGFHLDPSRGVCSRNGVIIIPLVGQDKRWTLSLPRGNRFTLRKSEIALRCRTIATSDTLFAEAEYLPEALIVFDNLSRAHSCEALLQEAHTPLEEFVRLNCSARHRSHLRMAIESVASAMTKPINHGSLDRFRICFDAHCNLRLMDYPIVDTLRRSDHSALGRAALLLFVAASDLKGYRALIDSPHNSPCEEQRRLRCLLSAAEHHGSTRLAALCSALLAGASHNEIATAVAHLAHERFAPLGLLYPLLTSRQPHQFYHLEGTPTLEEEELVRLDFALCERVEPAGDQMVRYLSGDHWGYAHQDGEIIRIEREVIAAYDFEEGRAVIRTPRGYGLVDTSGRLVMNDVWEQLCWYGGENVAVAADDTGRWHLYDRMGRQLSAVACDWLGDASEGFVVARRGGRFGYYSTDGERHTDFIYDEAFSFSGGRALVRRKGGPYFHIDTSFHRVVE